MENPLVKLVSDGPGEDAPLSTLGARSVSAIRDVENKIACEVIPPSLVTDAGGVEEREERIENEAVW